MKFRERGTLWMFLGLVITGIVMALLGYQNGVILSATGLLGVVFTIIQGFAIGLVLELINKEPDKPKVIIRTGWIVAAAFLLQRLLSPLFNRFMV